MQVMQRTLGILLAVFLIVLLPALEGWQQTKKAEKVWKQVLLQRFCEELCIAGVCTDESYLRYSEALQKGTTAYGLQITEYQRAEDVKSGSYWYCTVWEEIKEALFWQGKYLFAAGAAVELSAVASNGEHLFCGGHIRKGGG